VATFSLSSVPPKRGGSPCQRNLCFTTFSVSPHSHAPFARAATMQRIASFGSELQLERTAKAIQVLVSRLAAARSRPMLPSGRFDEELPSGGSTRRTRCGGSRTPPRLLLMDSSRRLEAWFIEIEPSSPENRQIDADHNDPQHADLCPKRTYPSPWSAAPKHVGRNANETANAGHPSRESPLNFAESSAVCCFG